MATKIIDVALGGEGTGLRLCKCIGSFRPDPPKER